jgi:hypothetical protein
MVEGERVGYLPGFSTPAAQLSTAVPWPARVPIFAEAFPNDLRAEAWVWIGARSHQWDWSKSKRPPMSSKAKARAEAEHAERRNSIREGRNGDDARAHELRAGMVNGVHFLELAERIKQLTREGRLEEALVLCYAAIEGAEGGRAGTGMHGARSDHPSQARPRGRGGPGPEAMACSLPAGAP